MSVEHLRLRASFGFGLVVVILGALSVRLASIQLASHENWAQTAHAQHYTKESDVPPERGAILDRNGEILARTEHLPSIAVDPALVKENGAALALLIERRLHVPRAEVLASIQRGGRYRLVVRRVRDRDAVDALRRDVRLAKISGLIVNEETVRVYPQGTLAAHVLGFTNREEAGVEGVEALCNRELSGLPGRATTLRDASGCEIVTAARQFVAPLDGSDIRLTIDLAIQSLAEDAAQDIWKEHAPDGVTCAVVDVRTGEILGLACRPTFDPNNPGDAKPEARRNRFFTDAYEPGSVFKTIVMAAALDTGAVGPRDTFVCDDGGFRVGGRVIHEDKHKKYGTLSLAGIIEHSSNVGMAQVGDRMGTASMKKQLTKWGFGTRTAVNWPGEQRGDLQLSRTWSRGDQLLSASFGHSITTTPAQIIQSYATLAAGGMRHELRLFTDVAVAPTPIVAPSRVCSEETAAALSPMLERVLGEDGTANWVYKSKDYRIGGKTGTAQKLKTGGHVASFCCYGPLDDPRLAVLVIADEPRKNGYYGSTIGAKRAVPLIRGALRILGVAPSPEVKTAARPVPSPRAETAANRPSAGAPVQASFDVAAKEHAR